MVDTLTMARAVNISNGQHSGLAADGAHESLQREMVHRLAVIAEYRDDETGAHAARVAAFSRAIAERMRVDADLARLIELAAPLHDLGKVAIPDAILAKAGPLDDAEREVMKRHTLIGARMLSDSELPALQLAGEIALTHHERWDGTGYPFGLGGSDIALSGRIVAIADVFDALTSSRPYKAAWPLDRARAEIRRVRAIHFDPVATDAFLTIDTGAIVAIRASCQTPLHPELIALRRTAESRVL
jgi:putative two-component system response regulator